MIIKSPNSANFLRDFKKYTSKELVKNIKQYEPNILKLFKNDEGGYSFWKMDNQPKIIDTEKFFDQKRDYIHNNPVIKGYVENPKHWKWSSANPNSTIIISRE